MDCINEQDLDEMNVEIIRNTLYRAYLEDFYRFCKSLGGKTAEVMSEILAVSRLFSNTYIILMVIWRFILITLRVLIILITFPNLIILSTLIHIFHLFEMT